MLTGISRPEGTPQSAPHLDMRQCPSALESLEGSCQEGDTALVETRSGPFQPLLNRVGRLQTPLVAMLAAAGLMGKNFQNPRCLRVLLTYAA
jgi:hypothetical protein